MPSMFNVFLDHSLSLRRKYRLQGCKNFIFACILFIAGCVMAATTWKLGAPLIFVLLYIILGTIGFIMYCFNTFKILPQTTGEKLPLLSHLHFKAAAKRKHKEYNISKTSQNCPDPATEMENSGKRCTNYTTNNVNEHPELVPCIASVILKYGSDVRGSVIKCVEPYSYPRVAQELCITGPGGGQSRKGLDDGQASSRKKRLSPLNSLFRTCSAEPSAQFHVPLTEIPLLEEASGTSQPRPTSNVQDGEAAVQWMSSNPREPIYQNIIPYPERRRIFTESAVFRELQYDIPSKELTPVQTRTSGMPVSIMQDATEVPPVEWSSYSSESGDRKKSQLSQERTYVNVFPSLEENRKSSTVIMPTGTETSRKDIKDCFASLSQASTHNIYVNVESKNQTDRPTEDADGTEVVRRYARRRDRPKTHEFWTIRQAEVRTTESNEYQNTRVNTSTGELKFDVLDHSPFSPANIYRNVSSLKHEGRNQMAGESDRCDENLLKVVKHFADSTGSELTPPENTYVNFPLDTTVRDKKSPTKTTEESNSENESSADIETGVSGENASINKTEVKSQDSNRGRSEYMYVTGLGPILKTYVKPGATGIRTIPSVADKHLPKKLTRGVGISSTEEQVVTKSRTLPVRDGTRVHKSFPNRTHLEYIPYVSPTEIIKGLSHVYSPSTGSNTPYHSSESACPESTKNETAERKHGYANPLYEANTSINEETGCMRTERKIEPWTVGSLFGKGNQTVRGLSGFQKGDITGQHIVEVKRTSESYETTLFCKTASNSSLEELETNKTLLQLHKNQAVPSWKINAMTTSEDEYSPSLLKSGGKVTVKKGAHFTSSESLTHSQDRHPSSYTKLADTPPCYERDTQKSKNSDHIFSPRKNCTSSATKRLSTDSMDTLLTRRDSISTSLEMSKKLHPVTERIMHESIQPKFQQVDTIDNSCSGSKTSLGSFPPISHIDLPVIENRSIIVQSQLKKFTQGSVKTAQKSLQLSTVQSSTHSSTSSSDLLVPSKSQVGTSNKNSPPAFTGRSSRFQSGHLSTSPTKRKPQQQSVDTSVTEAKAEMVSEQYSVFPHTTSHTNSTVLSSNESSLEKSAVFPTYSPVYF